MKRSACERYIVFITDLLSIAQLQKFRGFSRISNLQMCSKIRAPGGVFLVSNESPSSLPTAVRLGLEFTDLEFRVHQGLLYREGRAEDAAVAPPASSKEEGDGRQQRVGRRHPKWRVR